MLSIVKPVQVWQETSGQEFSLRVDDRFFFSPLIQLKAVSSFRLRFLSQNSERHDEKKTHYKIPCHGPKCAFELSFHGWWELLIATPRLPFTLTIFISESCPESAPTTPHLSNTWSFIWRRSVIKCFLPLWRKMKVWATTKRKSDFLQEASKAEHSSFLSQRPLWISPNFISQLFTSACSALGASWCLDSLYQCHWLISEGFIPPFKT